MTGIGGAYWLEYTFTPEHKAQRWEQYKASVIEDGKVDEGFETWSNKYDGGIDRVTTANKGVDDFLQTLGWPNCNPTTKCKEKSFTMADGKTRRLDIYNTFMGDRIGFEVKEYSTSVVYSSPDIIKEILYDRELLNLSSIDKLEWVFKGCVPRGKLIKILNGDAVGGIPAGTKIKYRIEP